MTTEEIRKELAEITAIARQKLPTPMEIVLKKRELEIMLDKAVMAEAEAENEKRRAKLTEAERNAEDLEELKDRLFCIEMADHYTADTYRVIAQLEKKIEELEKRV